MNNNLNKIQCIGVSKLLFVYKSYAEFKCQCWKKINSVWRRKLIYENVKRRGHHQFYRVSVLKKKYPNSIFFRYMVQLRLDNCTLVGRLLTCDAMFGF